ncbi:hypothetical protein MMC14_002313 [Varicellaria rhodocarpa]|nr:hypothetical protein [Varicellaria rhodocarpa]
MSTSETSINIPQLLIVLVLSGLAIRYFFFSRPTTTSPSRSSPRGRAARPEDVEQIASMFPQVGRREIMWDLQRNGGSVAATSERILGPAGLEVPPPSFQPPSLLSTSSLSSSSASAPSSSKDLTQLDLIQRYNLTSKLSQTSPETPSSTKEGWSNNKNERQALLQRRREDMILNARRKLEEEERVRKEKEKA